MCGNAYTASSSAGLLLCGRKKQEVNLEFKQAPLSLTSVCAVTQTTATTRCGTEADFRHNANTYIPPPVFAL